MLHDLYKPIPGKFKDYIAIPKANGYQSLHTTLFGPFGTPLEAQIRTHDMHRIAEAGVAAHWLYKSGGELDLAEAQQQTHRWLQSLLEIQSRVARLEGIPRAHQGRPVPRRGLRVHAQGQDHGAAARRDRGRLRLRRCTPTSATTASRARINYELMPLRTELKNGDHVEILTSPTARPNPSWLSFVGTGKARSRIRHFLKGLQQKESAALGERLLNQALATLKVAPGRDHLGSLGGAGARVRRARASSRSSPTSALGKRLSFVVAQALTRVAGRGADPSTTAAAAKPGERADAARRRGRGDPVRQVLPADPRRHGHRPVPPRPGPRWSTPATASTLRKQRVDPEQLVDVEWAHDVDGVFDAGIRLLVADRRGLLADLATGDRRRRGEHRQRVDGAPRRRRSAARCSSASR